MSSKACIDQADWDLLMFKFNQITEKYNRHNQCCRYHNFPKVINERWSCVNSKEYYYIANFDDVWSKKYKKHVKKCALHARFLKIKGLEFLEVFTGQCVSKNELIN